MQQQDKTLCHISIGTNRLKQATEFYDKLLPLLGIERVTAHEQSVAYGKGYPTFWVQIPYDQQPATVGNGSHIGFMATSRAQVDAFYHTALKLGAKCNGKPGPRPEYGEPYYGCFVIDLDGHRIEASFWDVNYQPS
ncbi:VOC family protein [Thalassotalea aquiviva]|uniref:VOC family protein n=1 Tax=Thalassotalea aquiviva TaxID=3242415 RepID=UPI00352B7969